MTKFGRSDDLQGAEFVEANLRGARFVESDLSQVVMRGVDIQAGDIDAPWLGTEDATLTINGVDVVPFIDAELNRRFPGRENRRATDPDGLRAAWAQVEQAWAAARERVNAMPAGTVDIAVDGEWSFAQTERHLIHATDIWFGQAIMELDDPFHPLGLSTSARTTRERRRRRTPMFSRAVPAASPWSATSSPPPPRPSSTPPGRTRTALRTPRPSATACT